MLNSKWEIENSQQKTIMDSTSHFPSMTGKNNQIYVDWSIESIYNTFVSGFFPFIFQLGNIIMDRQQIGVKLAIDSLDLPFKVKTFQDRLIMQKAVYIAQAKGVNLGYFYHWYIYGPYSPSLTRDEFAIAADIAADLDDSRGWKLDEKSSQRLKEIRTIFSGPDRDALATKLELLASVHFLIDRKQVSKIDTRQITTTLKRYNKDFSEHDVEGALEELQDYGLLAA